MPEPTFTRYVAIGDSQTEGLWDGDDVTGLTGFADRLALRLDSLNPGLMYANLAVRGRQVRDVLHDQLPQALAMEPDLITVCIGMNDVTEARPLERAFTELDLIYATLAQAPTAVITTTFPDIGRIVPVGRLLTSRVRRINAVIRAAAERHGFGLVDLYSAPSMYQPDTWSDDFIHASAKGHALFAEAAAEALGLPGSSHDWAHAQNSAPLSAVGRGRALVSWTANMLVPWLWEQANGRSAGDGRHPKRPRLELVAAR